METVAAASDHEVVVAVDAQLDGPAQPRSRHRSHAGEHRALRFLAAEAATHAPAFHLHRVQRPVQHVRHVVLHFARVLGAAVDLHAAVFDRHRNADLPFQIKLFLPAQFELQRQALRRSSHRGRRVTALQVHGRHHVLLRGVRGLRRQDGRQRPCAHHLARQGGGATRRVAAVRDHGKHRLAEVVQRVAGLTCQDGFIRQQSAALVGAGQVACAEHIHHAGLLANAVQVQALDDAVRQGRQAQHRMQRARQFRQVVGVGRGTGHMQMRRFVRAVQADLREDVFCSRQIERLVHTGSPRAQTFSAASGSGWSGRVSSQQRRKRFCATCSR